MEKRRVMVTLMKYNEEVLKDGLEEAGVNLNELSDDELGTMLTHALGFVDYAQPSIIDEMLESIGKRRKDEES
jgi:hypothetical protein